MPDDEQELPPDAVDDATAEEASDEAEVSTETDLALEEVSQLLVTSEAALTFPEARTLTSHRGGRLVLLMGEIKAGKTTLMAETWTHLVARGPLGGHRFAGSRTVMAFEERAFLSRLNAGTGRADTKRTHEEEDGLLHLRIADPDGKRFEILLADFAGEHFEGIRDGTPLLDELPWAGRCDRVGVLLDGEQIGLGGGELELAFTRATRQLFGVRAAGGIAPSAHLAILLVKVDKASDASLAAAQVRLDHLMEEAKSVDPEAALISLSARPEDGSDPVGLDLFVKWVAGPNRPVSPAKVDVPQPRRAMSRIRP